MRNRKTKNLIVSLLLHTLLLLVVYIFQGGIFPYVRIGGLVPLLFPVAVAGVALYEGRDVGGVFGLFAGIFCDVSFNQPIGTFTVVLTVAGLGIGMLSDTVILSSFVTYYISCTVVLILCAFVQMIPIIVRLGNNNIDIPVANIVGITLTQTLYALILALPIWPAVRTLGKRAEHITPSGRMV